MINYLPHVIIFICVCLLVQSIALLRIIYFLTKLTNSSESPEVKQFSDGGVYTFDDRVKVDTSMKPDEELNLKGLFK